MPPKGPSYSRRNPWHLSGVTFLKSCFRLSVKIYELFRLFDALEPLLHDADKIRVKVVIGRRVCEHAGHVIRDELAAELGGHAYRAGVSVEGLALLVARILLVVALEHVRIEIPGVVAVAPGIATLLQFVPSVGDVLVSDGAPSVRLVEADIRKHLRIEGIGGLQILHER
jgi:hypothetical protein